MIRISEPIIEIREIENVINVLRSGQIAQGPKVREFENSFTKYCNARYSIAVNNGTAALHTALFALGVKDQDEVITSPFTFVATANSILMQKANVVFADIDKTTFNISPEEIEKKITKKTKAIIAVDLYGNPCNYEGILKICKKNNLLFIADSCQAIGAEYQGSKIGSADLADITVFSLYATKNITCGEGGIITTDKEIYSNRCKMFRHHGQGESNQYEYETMGYNYRITDIQASIAVEQIKKLDKLNNQRIRNARYLTKGLKNIRGLITPIEDLSNKHVFHQYTVRITKEFKTTREEFIKYLHSVGIGAGIYYPKPLHLHKHFAFLKYRNGDFPVAEVASLEVVSLPVHPRLTIKDLEFMMRKIKDYAK